MSSYLYASLSKSLNRFELPDTSSGSSGKVPAGNYPIREYLENHTDSNTDYANIEVPGLGDSDTWICTRWRDNVYANVEKADMSIDESFLIKLLPYFNDFSFHISEANYPFELSGFNAPIAPPNTNNCCTFVEALLVKAWENAKPGFSWSWGNHEQMMIFSTENYYSPITCLVNEEMAEAVNDPDQAPHPWSVIQGWNEEKTSGHTFIILDYHPESDRVLTLESNSAYLLNGVGYRMVGNIRDFPRPTQGWWENEKLWTWSKMKSAYRARKQCVLKVKNLKWI